MATEALVQGSGSVSLNARSPAMPKPDVRTTLTRGPAGKKSSGRTPSVMELKTWKFGGAAVPLP